MKKSLLLASFFTALLVATAALNPMPAVAQDNNDDHATIDPQVLDGLEFRSLNFTRGGRSTAVAGVVDDPLTYYFGASGGGLWKTADAGTSWNNVSDGFFGVGTIGAIAVAPSDVNVIYAGTGSACPRGNVSAGDGIYRSTDAGKNWSKVLPMRAQVGKIAVHPSNHNVVYAAVLGNIFGAGEERGVYRSMDGGDTWDKVLYIDDNTGSVDIEIDPNNPRILLTSIWTAERKPWTIDSGSEDDGIYRTKDGGDTWERLENGLPTSMMGKTSVAISPANSDRMWALIEATEDHGGVYRSDDGGDSWRRTNSDRSLQQRAWYYIHIFADPQDEDTVYALNTGMLKSTDSGRTFDTRLRVPHGDNHDLWINPNNPKVMINSNDGGANVSFNAGVSWRHQRNQPTTEIYRITVDQEHPYRVYGAQQDNSTARLSSRRAGGFGGGGDFGAEFQSVGGGESGHIAVDPRSNEVVYAGSYGGTITWRDMDENITRNVRAYPEAQTGQQALDMTYRFQWNAPIRISPHDPDVVYHTSQFVHRTSNAGQSWDVISPDLTRNDPETQGYSGLPITRDNTGVEVFNTISAFEESTHTAGLLWAGTDDGRVWLSRNAGGDWTEITPEAMPERGTVNNIDISAHDPGRIHMSVHKYRENDFRPYIFRTNDYGVSWELLTSGSNGIPDDHFVRVVREDPNRRGLLYAGTEFGMFASFDDGANWQSLQLNLPIVPITDLQVHREDLVVATQGRAFWVLDNLSPLHQVDGTIAAADAHLFTPRDSMRGPGGSTQIDFYLNEKPDGPVELEIMDADGEMVTSFTARQEGQDEPGAGVGGPGGGGGGFGGFGGGARLSADAGLNRFNWNQRHEALFTRPRGIVMWGGGGTAGPKAVPGEYQAKLTVGEWSQTQTFTVGIDPRLDTTVADFEEQYELAVEVGTKMDELWSALTDLRDVKQQVSALSQRLRDQEGGDDLGSMSRELSTALTAVEGEITQLEGEGGQDALNFPGRFDNQWAALYGAVSSPDHPVPAGTKQRLVDLTPRFDELLAQVRAIYDTQLVAFNNSVRAMNVAPVIAPADGATGTGGAEGNEGSGR